MVKFELLLTNQQMKKVQSGKAVQLSYKNLINPTGELEFVFDAPRALYNRIHRAFVKKTGVRLPAGVSQFATNDIKENIEGDGIKSDFKKFGRKLKRAFKPAVPVLKKVGTALLPIAKEVGKAVIKEGLPIAGEAAGAAAGMYFGPASAAIGSQLGKTAGNAAAGAINKQIGNGLKRPAKGSQEAKDKMAALRAMKKTKGSGFGSIAKSVAKDVGKQALKKGTDYAVKKGVDMAVSSMTGEGLVEKRHRKVKVPVVVASSNKGAKIKNPRVKIPNSNGLLLHGIPQVSGGSFQGFSGGSFRGFLTE